MAFRACIALLLSSFVYPMTSFALESLDDTLMSNVVAQEGVRLRAEYEVAIDNLQYFDEDDHGTISMTDINIATRAQQVIDIDIIAGKAAADSLTNIDRVGRNGVRLSNRELPIDLSVDIVRINGKSIGGFGMTNMTTGYNSGDATHDPLIVDVWAGGYKETDKTNINESGFTIDIKVPKKSSYDLYYEDDGTRLGMTVDYCANRSEAISACSAGGLNIEGLTFDVTSKGLRLGIPEVSGQVNFRNFKISESPINDVTLKNFNIAPGGYINIGAPNVVGESAIEFDVYIASGTGFDFQFFDTSDSDVQQMNATIGIGALASDASTPETNFFHVKNSSINIGKNANQGVKVELGGVRGSVSANDIILKPVNAVGSIPTLGSIKMNLDIAAGSFVEVMGH